jgi:hypothetical protein
LVGLLGRFEGGRREVAMEMEMREKSRVRIEKFERKNFEWNLVHYSMKIVN